MPEDLGDKTEAPTPRKREEARKHGQVARSMDLSAAAVLLGGLLLLELFGPHLMQTLRSIMQRLLSAEANQYTASRLGTVAYMAGEAAVWALAPLVLLLVVVAVVANLIQVGVLFSGYPLVPRLSKISPLTGVKRIISLQGLMRLLMSMLKVALIAAVSYLTVRQFLPRIVNLVGADYWKLLGAGAEVIFTLGVRLGATLLVLAVMDFLYQRWQHEKDLRMTRQEVREELRRMEGDPLMRERRLRVARQLALQRMAAAVPKADVVVTNPTEVAVALKYDAETMNAPQVVAKGQDYLAMRIRQIAAAAGVPILERPPLARALYKAVEVGQEIPPQFYRAVAEILAYVYELAGKGLRRSQPAPA